MTTPDSANEPAETQADLRQLLPSAWNSTTSDIWCTVFRAYGLAKADLPKQVTIDMGEVQCLLFWGTVNYPVATIELAANEDGTQQITVSYRGTVSTPPGATMLLAALSNPAESDSAEATARSSFDQAAATIAALNTPDLVFEHLADFTLKSDGTITVFSPAIRAPGFRGKPVLTTDALDELKSAVQALGSLPDNERTRIRLSLHWLGRGARTSGVDGLLYHWIAIEAIAMPDTTNIRPALATLATLYGVTAAEANDRFRLGRLFGLRSRIVHHGLSIGIHQNVIDYMSAMYTDILRSTLGLPHVGAASRYLSEAAPIDEWWPAE